MSPLLVLTGFFFVVLFATVCAVEILLWLEEMAEKPIPWFRRLFIEDLFLVACVDPIVKWSPVWAPFSLAVLAGTLFGIAAGWNGWAWLSAPFGIVASGWVLSKALPRLVMMLWITVVVALRCWAGPDKPNGDEIDELRELANSPKWSPNNLRARTNLPKI